jgi:hypothetical protein
MQDQRTPVRRRRGLSGGPFGQIGAAEEGAEIGVARIPTQLDQRVQAEPCAFAEPAGGGQQATDRQRAIVASRRRRGEGRDPVDRAVEQGATPFARQGAPKPMQRGEKPGQDESARV